MSLKSLIKVANYYELKYQFSKSATMGLMAADIEDALLNSNYFFTPDKQQMYQDLAVKHKYTGPVTITGALGKAIPFNLIVKSNNEKFSTELKQKLNPGASQIVNKVLKEKGTPEKDIRLKEDFVPFEVNAGGEE
jgi:hypothetical protein